MNTPLLEKIAYENRGFTTFVLPAEDVEVKVGRVFDRLKGPVLADPELVIGGDGPRRASELIPDRLPDLFEGDQIVLLGRYRGDDPLEFTLRGNHRGTPRTFQFRLPLDGATTRNGFVPRLWAGRKIGLLVDAVRRQGADGSASSLGAKRRVAPMARAGRGDRPALDRVRHPDRVHRVPRARGDRPVEEGGRSCRSASDVLRSAGHPDADRLRLGESGYQQSGPQVACRASTRSTSSSART